MAIQNTNIGRAFPLEKLGSDIARNEFNYQSILTGLIEWDRTNEDTVNIRLSKDSDPWFEDFNIPSKKAVFDLNTTEVTINEATYYNHFVMESIMDLALFGGKHKNSVAYFNAVTDVSTASDYILAVDESNDQYFQIGDVVIFEGVDDGSPPGGLLTTNKYVIRLITNREVTFYEEDGTTPVDITSTGYGTAVMKKLVDEPFIDTTDPGDILTFRITVKNNGNADWRLYYYQLVSDWVEGTEYRFGNLIIHNDIIYKSIVDHVASGTYPVSDTAHYEVFIKPWVSGTDYDIGDFVSYESNLYRVINITHSSILNPVQDIVAYELYAPAWVLGADYKAGIYVFYEGLPYIAKVDNANSTGTPVVDTDTWEFAFIRPVPVSGAFNQSTVVRWQLESDITKIIVKNVTPSQADSNAKTDINFSLSVKTKEPNSIYQRSVDVFQTCNYAFWPYDKTAMWNSYAVIDPTDDALQITERQLYSATMVYQHINPDVAKTVNFVNYDGPDLDQGLCIYLISECQVAGTGGTNCIARPEDGFTFEFYFRIWPNVNLTQDVTRDHIINKSQIYVYSALNLDDVRDNACGYPIAKFSMARTTNFYVFGENIAIPDKPVCYRATFIYSEIEGKWITLDYYQLPDHVFIGPVGFVDLQNPNNIFLDSHIIGNTNPNAQHIGYETAAFPLFQDPFAESL